MNFHDWCLSNSEKINLEIISLSWIQEFFPRYHDFSVKVLLDGSFSEGFGFDIDKDLALTKAISESLERTVVRDKIITSNGIAAHSTLKHAKAGARAELIERDLFLSHFFTKTPFFMVSQNEFKIPEKFSKYVHQNGDQIRLFKTKSSNFGTTYICLISNEIVWGGIISIQICQSNSRNEILKCIINAGRTYRFEMIKGGFKHKISLEDFKKIVNVSFRDHQNLTLNLDYFKKISFLFDVSPISNDKRLLKYLESDFNYQVIKLSNSILDCPLQIVKCSSESVISLLPGVPNLKNIPDKAIKRFLDCINVDLNNLPHPLS